ncbi:NYN domain-containing protein [Neogemmobacter tilapiae]|uniref:HTH OST-type domain-containing protein n=1 Tax=Neogemmobacter tilapiae TaxID=875041 RepID=A0A918TIP8_9RHOB|nr:NYN domain-containing protein [Gemmobacter tilapiae]GHC47591.1 hypothetical protein GCM10007315_06770 [Gemmobacter tilapiae]
MADAKLLAVLIDADNVPARHAGAILREITAFGEPSLRRVYGDWSSSALSAWKEQARELGLVMHQQSANTKGKNASDIGLVIDAMDILHRGKVDGFVLVSSDSDFTRLASRIREDGLEVIGIGEAKTPESLRNVCNRFVLIENITTLDDHPKELSPPPKPNPKLAAGQEKKAEAPTQVPMAEAPKKDPPSKVIPLVLDAMKKIDPDQEWFGLGQIGQFIVKAKPDFDSRTYGSAKLSDLLTKTGRFEVKQGSGNSLVVRDKA